MDLSEATLLDQQEIAVTRSWATHARVYRLALFLRLVSQFFSGLKTLMQCKNSVKDMQWLYLCSQLFPRGTMPCVFLNWRYYHGSFLAYSWGLIYDALPYKMKKCARYWYQLQHSKLNFCRNVYLLARQFVALKGKLTCNCRALQGCKLCNCMWDGMQCAINELRANNHSIDQNDSIKGWEGDSSNIGIITGQLTWTYPDTLHSRWDWTHVQV